MDNTVIYNRNKGNEIKNMSGKILLRNPKMAKKWTNDKWSIWLYGSSDRCSSHRPVLNLIHFSDRVSLHIRTYQIENPSKDSTGSSDQSLIARKVIKIGSLIYRKLNKEKQFLYTLVQDHSIWSNEQFWIEHFFHQHQRRLVAHYRRQATSSSESPEKPKSVHGPENAHNGDGDSDNFLVCSEMMDNTEVHLKVTLDHI